jgi:hypothetical protein
MQRIPITLNEFIGDTKLLHAFGTPSVCSMKQALAEGRPFIFQTALGQEQERWRVIRRLIWNKFRARFSGTRRERKKKMNALLRRGDAAIREFFGAGIIQDAQSLLVLGHTKRGKSYFRGIPPCHVQIVDLGDEFIQTSRET